MSFGHGLRCARAPWVGGWGAAVGRFGGRMFVPVNLSFAAAAMTATLVLTACFALSKPGPSVISRRVVLSSAVIGYGVAPSGAVEKIDASKVKSTQSGAKYVVVKEGKCPTTDPTGLAGSCLPQEGSLAIIDYTGFLPSGDVFDTTEKKGGKPLVFKIGGNQVITGLEDVVKLMLPGEEVQALIPAKIAYGERGVCTDSGECLIPPNTDLKYFIRLVRIAVQPS